MMQTALFFVSLSAAFSLAAFSAPAIDVARFGAAPNDGKDQTPAFLAAFRAALTNNDKRIVIPKGLYHLRADGNPERHDVLFPATRVNNLTIEGRGAELRMSGNATVFLFAECTNLTVRGITVDWERPPFSEGTVVATTPRYFDVQIAPGYPVQGGEPVGAFMSYDPATRLPTGKNMDIYNSVERTELIRPQVLRVHLTHDVPVPVRTLLVLRHQVYGYNAFTFLRCANVRVSDVNVYAVPGMGLVAVNSADVSLHRFNVRIRPGSARLMSATADATHFGGCKGTVSLKDCFFEGMGDDGANIKSGLYLIVRKRVDDHTVLGQHNLKMTDLPDHGDLMEMSHTDTLLPFATGTVGAARLDPGEGNMHRITFEEPLPTDLREGDVLGNSTRAPKLRMRRCTVQSNRARGVLCQTRDALIERCTFRNCTSAGVLVLTEVVYFYESIGTRNVTVRNNRFENCNLGAASAEAQLAALAWLKDFSYPPRPGVHRDISFNKNRFISPDPRAIFAVGVDGLTIRDNQVKQSGRQSFPEEGNAIRVTNCTRVAIKDNRVNGGVQQMRSR